MLLAAALLFAAPPPERATDGCPGAYVYFESGSARLNRQAPEIVEGLLRWARPMVDAGAWLNLVGGTDDVGPAGANLALSRRRAEAVRDYLVTQGIARNRLRIEANGESRPLAEPGFMGANVAQTRAQNRNVGIHPEMPIAVFRRFFPPGGAIC